MLFYIQNFYNKILFEFDLLSWQGNNSLKSPISNGGQADFGSSFLLKNIVAIISTRGGVLSGSCPSNITFT